jgi:hypothetical protein
MSSVSGSADVVILVKALPHTSTRHGETVCCAGIERAAGGGWLRLYPISFRYLDHAQRFGRWDVIKLNWKLPNNDQRQESRRVDHASLEIVGKLQPRERERFLAAHEVTGLVPVTGLKRSLALVRPRQPHFSIERKSADELEIEQRERQNLLAQQDMFPAHRLIPLEPCPYRFKYSYLLDEGRRNGTCEDWETEATYFNLRREYGEEKALAEMRRTFGERYPSEGMVFAMGTHSRFPDRWLIVGVIRLNEMRQGSLL